MNTIKVTIKNVYGNSLIYPVCPTAKLFAEIIGKKTLPIEVINLIKKLGYEVELVAEKGTL